MSKKFKAGCDEVFDGTDPYTVTFNSSDEMGEDGVYITLSNSGDNIGLIKQYVNKIRESGDMEPLIKREIGGSDVALTVPPLLTVGEQNSITLYAPYLDLNIIDSAEVELSDKVFELFNHFITDRGVFLDLQTLRNTDGVLQDFVRVTLGPIQLGGDSIYKTVLVSAEGCQDTEFTVDKNSPGGYIFYHHGELTACVSADIRVNVLSKLTSKTLHTLYETVTNYPHKPTLEKIIRRGRVYLKVTNNTQCHGNIYFDGSPTPCYEYSIPVGNSVEFELPSGAGAYTANVISQTDVMGTYVYRYAYSELSDTLIVEAQNIECLLSFNEYTGELSCIADEPDTVYAYALEEFIGDKWVRRETSGSSIFKITHSGTYRVKIDEVSIFTHTVFPESITVIATLNTPVAYSDPAFPSQLGFDEVENANMYDIYRVNEDGDDELVATISPNNIISRIMRKEKMFIVIPNDEVRNV